MIRGMKKKRQLTTVDLEDKELKMLAQVRRKLRAPSKSETIRMDAGLGLGVLLRELCEDVSIWTFSDNLVQVPPRRGFALRDAMKHSQPHSGTHLAGALQTLHGLHKYDRIIVITDEQTHDGIVAPHGVGYVINVASYKNGIGYGAWTHIDGWSESVIDYVRHAESELR